MAKITLKHPETGDVRVVKDAATAVALQAHHGYKVEKPAATPAVIQPKKS